MTEKGKKGANPGVAGMILGQVDKIIPGFQDFCKKVEKSPVFGIRIAEIRKEIERRFGGVKK